MSDAPMKPDPLEDDFQALKSTVSAPSDDLMARVMADADTVQNQFMTQTAPQFERQSFTARFLAAIGGWPSMAGLATAGIAGVWIGVSQPAALVASSEALLYGTAGNALVDLDPGFGFSDLDGGL